MKIIISPAKKMRVDNDTFVPLSNPAFLDRTVKLKDELCKMDYASLKKLWECNDEIAELNFKRFLRLPMF